MFDSVVERLEEKRAQREKIWIVQHITGCGMSECRRALRYSGWNITRAIKYIREHPEL